MKLIKHWKPIIISLIILYGSITSGDTFNKVHFLAIPNFDKLVHFIFYFFLSISFYATLYQNTSLNKYELKIIVLLFTISYGLIIEILQYYYTSRFAELLDMFANIVGCVTGVLIFPVLKKLHLTRYL